MSADSKASRRILSLLLTGAVLLGAWASPVFAVAADGEPPGAAQEAEAPSVLGQEDGENPEGEPLNIISLAEPEGGGSGPENTEPAEPETENGAGPEDGQPRQTPALGASGIAPRLGRPHFSRCGGSASGQSRKPARRD